MGEEGHSCGCVASTGQHCLMFQHTKLIQEALECESLKSQDLARALEGELGKKTKQNMEISSNRKQ